MCLFSREATSLSLMWVANPFPFLWLTFYVPSLSEKQEDQHSNMIQFLNLVFSWGNVHCILFKNSSPTLGPYIYFILYIPKDPIVLPFKVRISCHLGLIVVQGMRHASFFAPNGHAIVSILYSENAFRHPTHTCPTALAQHIHRVCHPQMWICFWPPFSIVGLFVGSCPNTKLYLFAPLHFCFIVVNYTKYKLPNQPFVLILQWYLVHSAWATIITIHLQRSSPSCNWSAVPLCTNYTLSPPSSSRNNHFTEVLPLRSGQHLSTSNMQSHIALIFCDFYFS